MRESHFSSDQLSIGGKLRAINWFLVLAIIAIGLIGVGLLYSVDGMAWDPWASQQLTRFIVGFVMMIMLALIDLRVWLRLAYPLYAFVLTLLIGVEIIGQVGMGAQRWISFGAFVIQPSELMKITLILVLARYFHALPMEDIGNPFKLVFPVLLALVPVGLVLMQPNLGTATLLLAAAGAIFFVAGVKWWKFAALGMIAGATLPIAWNFLHDYQKKRLMTFLDPDADPLGAGYNIMQSKIALGSGGLFGKGWGLGTQSQLQFLPEKHTDFIFVVLAEEFGMAGALVLLALYGLVLGLGLLIAIGSRSQFARLAAYGLTVNFFLYMCVNVLMVTGLIPVVGIPLPLVSYGGTAMLTLMIGFGILLSIGVHRDTRISRTGISEF
ncbi:MAG: rod shape-determining protein RodA [Alphaproteobacteria bacterium]|nr:rod shape-determining protein RodA [Alphaproteobacteria bacterium]